MRWLARLLTRVRDVIPDPDKERVSRRLDASEARADRVIADYRRLDELHRIAGARSRKAGERLIDEVTGERE